VLLVLQELQVLLENLVLLVLLVLQGHQEQVERMV
jgi:hypothetical protein